ncbi:hypothetical protein [Alteriqipengyuania lutimaris]|uniref:CBM-cenC domain-containing protein n=1 Tax=Alteriqipengyuania lutimaris TaxID=1538146 RepID=A0A395LKU6_9SPHN|nr:hypothetical protein [Alteriqipengyuania lutimaris]MBB3033665.1 hypothetical protein [Alteriqipengyuania lutimaris]RDS77345.1 hypothetical protein DL238_06765 [Alteriqipengyuania lutimaris]
MLGRTITIALSTSALLLAAPQVLAQGLPPELEAFSEQLPGSLINDPRDLVWQTEGAALDVEGVQDETIPGGGAARRYEVSSKGPDLWSSQTYVPLLEGIARGDTVTIGFHARTVSADTADGKGVIAVRVQENGPPYGGFADDTISVGSDWEWYEVSGTANAAYASDEARVVFQLGGAKQTVEIGQTIVVTGASSILGAPKPDQPEPVETEEPLIPDPLTDAGTLLNRPDLRNWTRGATVGTIEDREDSSIWLGKATRYSLDAPGENDWDLVAGIPIQEPIAEGDKLLIAIAAKTVSAQTADGKGLVAMRIQDRTPPYDGFAQNLFTVGENWQLIRINTTAPRDLPAGSAELALHFAAEAQAIDIGPVYIFRAE